MKNAFNMPILWGSVVKQFVDGLKESSVYFLKYKRGKQSERSQAMSCNLMK